MAGQGDAFQQVLLNQLQQNALLLKKFVAPKHADPIVGLLSGSDSGSASAGGYSVKGCLARDAFVRTSHDLQAVASTVRRQALQELGLDSSREDGNLMKKYVERRIPLADHRTLAYVATLCAEGWHTAFQSQNVELMGVLGKLLMFCEQAAIDAGKLQLAWLLTGHQEPVWQVLVSHRKRPGLQPFSRLAWVSANLAYLKELDYMETRLQSLSKTPGAEKPDRDEEKPKAKPKPKKGKGKGSASSSTTAAETEPQS